MSEKVFAKWLKQSKGSMPKPGVRAVHTRWYDIGTVEFLGKVLHVGDLWYHDEEGDAKIRITSGRFRVQVKGAKFDRLHRIAAVRVFSGAAEPKTDKPIGNILVDSWSILIGDLKDLYHDFDDDATREKWWDKNLFGKYAKGVEIKEFKVGKRKAPFVLAFTGLGSGAYQARALTAAKKVVGLEVEFIESGYLIE